VLTVRQEVRNYSVTYRQGLEDHPNSLARTLFNKQNAILGLSGITPQI
jgi:hypothetical protein